MKNNPIFQTEMGKIAGLLDGETDSQTPLQQKLAQLGKYLGKEPIFENECGSDAYLNDASLAMETFGYPAVNAKTLIRWQAQWLLDGGRTLDKPTHFEARNGKY